MGRVLAKLTIAAVFTFVLFGPAFAWSDGDYGGGCCDLAAQALSDQDPEIAKRGLDFYEILKKEPEATLVLLEALDDKVCSQYDCSGLESPVVQRLVKIARETVRKETENSWQLWNYITNAFNALLALSALGLSLLAYRSSRK